MQQRILSIDFLRGLTIFLMIVVNNPGSWGAWDDVNSLWINHLFLPLSHAAWHGATPTDMIFPFFIFIMGCSIAFALGKKKETQSKNQLVLTVIKRGALIFLLGFLKDNFPFMYFNPEGELLFKEFTSYRIMGVLQRLGIVFMLTGTLFLFTNWKQQLYVAAGILLVYWGIIHVEITGLFVKDLNREGLFNFGTYLDHLILGESHLWRNGWEPEGLLGTVTTSVATCLMGVLSGQWIVSDKTLLEKISGLFAIGGVLVVLGLFWDMALPINKGLWTSSYVVYAGGIAMLCTAFSLWIIDYLQFTKFTAPAIKFGSNALTAYLLSELVSNLVHFIPFKGSSLSGYMADGILSIFTSTPYHEIFINHPDLIWAKIASHLYAIIWIIPFYILLSWMYKKKIFIKV
jgi:predicted acyltransferase